MTGTGGLGAERIVEEANRLVAYHAAISRAMTTERTSLESGLIPVTAYILVACCEAGARRSKVMRLEGEKGYSLFFFQASKAWARSVTTLLLGGAVLHDNDH